MKKLLFGFLATILLTFTVNAQGTLRANFLKGKTYEQVVTDFNKLTNDEKNDLWIEKMDQVLGEDLPMEHKTILTQVRGLLKKNKRSNVDELIPLLLDLAKITPIEDFVNIIENLNDYNFNEKFIGSDIVTESILIDIERLGTNQESNDTNVDGKLRACNCRYSCDWFTRNTTSSGTSSKNKNCRETVDGCGPFGMSTCDGWH